MKHWVAILISLLSVVSGAERINLLEPVSYAKGAINEDDYMTPEFAEFIRSRMKNPLPKLGLGAELLILKKGSVTLNMTEVKNQKSVRSCAAFALAACCEYLYPGVKFSEAELFIRVKTASVIPLRHIDGSALASYSKIVEEGLVEEQYFLPYEVYNCARANKN